MSVCFSDCLFDGVDGWCESPIQDMPAVPVDVLAWRSQGPHLDQLSGRADEHGREVEAEDRLWPRRGRQSGRDWKVGGRKIAKCGTEIPLSY